MFNQHWGSLKYPWFLFILVNSGLLFSLVQGLWEPRRVHEGAGGAGQGLAALGAAKAAGADDGRWFWHDQPRYQWYSIAYRGLTVWPSKMGMKHHTYHTLEWTFIMTDGGNWRYTLRSFDSFLWKITTLIGKVSINGSFSIGYVTEG